MAGDDAIAEGHGETLGEAKWAAVKTLERRFPGLTADAVSFEELGGEGEVRIRATVDVDAYEASIEELPDEPVERVREMVTRVCNTLDLRASVDVVEDDEEIRATVNGEDLGLLIGKRGSTIDALQHLAHRVAFRGSDERRRVVVDAAGYRERREGALKRMADRAVSDALSYGRSVELEPMSAPERKIVHQYLSENNEVETHSEGTEPDRRLVVSPLRP